MCSLTIIWRTLGVLVFCSYSLVANAITNITNPFPDPVTADKNIYLKTISQGSAANLNDPAASQNLSNDLSAPLSGTGIPGHNDKLAVADQTGKIWLIDLITSARSLFLDLATQPQVNFVTLNKVYDERGLWGLAFDKNFKNNGLFYTYNSDYYCNPANVIACLPGFTPIPATFTLPAETPYTPFGLPVHPDHQSVLRMWHIDPVNLDNPTFVKEILRIDKPQSNHNAGILTIGPDGMLYLAVADGGSAADFGPGHLEPGPDGIGGGNSQNLNVIFGKILRIDPNPDIKNLMNNKEVLSSSGNYAIPTDNPHFPDNANAVVGGQDGCNDPNGNGCAEIYAHGFRNPYSMAFDKQAGRLYIGDVGQDTIEEVNVIDKGKGGGNYGWRTKEGSFCFNVGYPYPVPPAFNILFGGTWVNDPSLCPGDGLIDPVAEYDHSEGISVIGGYVYRGNNVDLGRMHGNYIFGDYKRPGFFAFLDGRLFYLVKKNINSKEKSEIKAFNIIDDVARPVNTRMLVFGFAQDNDGELYVLGKWATLGPALPNLGPLGNLGFIKKIVKVTDIAQ